MKIVIQIEYIEIPGGVECVFNLRNYSDTSLETADYNGFYSLRIFGPDVGNDSFFSNPSTYTVIKGIKKLEIREQMQQRSEEEGIDWYACWPELEEIIVIE